VAARAAQQARDLGLHPVLVTALQLGERTDAPTSGGPEATARAARYRALDAALAATGARAVLLGHTLDDQAETVLLGLARGAGSSSLSGMSPMAQSAAGARLRPLLGVRRAVTEAFCADSGLEPWHDPHNDSDAFTRVRVRRSVLPVLESELGPGVAEALARTAEQLREDDETLHAMAIETIEDLVEPAEAGIAISVRALEANPPALRHRVIRYVVASEFGASLSRVQTLAVAGLATDWHGQKGVDLPGIRVVRRGSRLEFSRTARAGDSG
jgi:tRNA(Ile)-lysidine synthase